MNLFRIALTGMCLTIGCVAIAQEQNTIGTEVIDVVKPYTPSISEAFKVKETPVLDESIETQKKQVDYDIFSVPVASTFEPDRGTVTEVEKPAPVGQFDNYSSLGFGNYTSILGELYTNFGLSRTDNAGIFIRHNSAQGDIDGILLEDKYYDTQLEGNYTSRQDDLSYRADIGVEHQLINWYGLADSYRDMPLEDIGMIDPQQIYFSAFGEGSIALEDSFFRRGSVHLRYFGDSFSSSEVYFQAIPEFEFALNTFTLLVESDINYLGGSFDRMLFGGPGYDYQFMNLGVAPSLVYVNDDLTLSLGAIGYMAYSLEENESEPSIYPRINVSYKAVDEVLVVYGGVDGGLHQNSYYQFKEGNRFIAPNVVVAPTNKMYNAFGGIKGNLSNKVGYNVRASYAKEDSKPLFVINNVQLALEPSQGYEYGNSFYVTYDDVNILNLFGEVNVAVSENFSMGAKGEYFSYNMTEELRPWNLPDFKATVYSKFKISDKVNGGVSLFYVGERPVQPLVFGPNLFPDPAGTTIDGYIDLNAQLSYAINDRLSIFANGSNLVGDNYLKWANYPVQGIQALLGATYRFDWE